MARSRRDFLRNSACALGGLAMASSVESFGIINALTPQAASEYKALVCIFLNGGNDGNNMVISLDQYAQYSAERNTAGLAFPQASLIPISPSSGGSYGLNPWLSPEVANPSAPFRGLLDIWNQGKLGVLCNNGPLVEPLTRTTYQNGAGKKPLQLFSHSDQVGLFSTAIANTVSQTGWGGRVADRTGILNGSSTFPQNISIAGINLLLTGLDTRQLAIGDSNTTLANVLPLTMTGSATEQASRLVSFNELRALDHDFKLIKAASDTRTSALQTRAALASVNPVLTTAFPNTSIGRQLLQIARVIKASTDPVAGIDMKRQIFFAQIGGFDTHSTQHPPIVNGNPGGQDSLLQQVATAMRAFYEATIELGVRDKVTTFTLSDFGRTFQPAGTGNAVGSDHAWGNHHFIMGGSVVGGRFYGTYPTLQRGGPDDTDGGSNPRGRWIPTTSVEQYAATLAHWYGLSSVDLPAVFPLIGRFSTSNLGFLG